MNVVTQNSSSLGYVLLVCVRACVCVCVCVCVPEGLECEIEYPVHSTSGNTAYDSVEDPNPEIQFITNVT